MVPVYRRLTFQTEPPGTYTHLQMSALSDRNQRRFSLVQNRGCSSVVRESEFKSEDPGFDPMVGQGEEQVFCPPPSQLLCRLVCAWPPFVCTWKDPVSICRNRVGLTSCGMETRKHCTEDKKYCNCFLVIKTHRFSAWHAFCVSCRLVYVKLQTFSVIMTPALIHPCPAKVNTLRCHWLKESVLFTGVPIYWWQCDCEHCCCCSGSVLLFASFVHVLLTV